MASNARSPRYGDFSRRQPHLLAAPRKGTPSQRTASHEYRAAKWFVHDEPTRAAVGDVSKARGVSIIAEQTGLGRESLCKALAPSAKPRYDTILKVLSSLGVKLTVTASQSATRVMSRERPRLRKATT
ncbi:MAG: putative addiction module antidote protein [Betaproteobacteria bacterium]|nr:putative addiction module antidote protein [Betaproteobacteria bacterium]